MEKKSIAEDNWLNLLIVAAQYAIEEMECVCEEGRLTCMRCETLAAIKKAEEELKCSRC